MYRIIKNKRDKFFYQKGVSLSEALAAIVVSTIVFAAAYGIYNNFQKTFIKQINYNNIKQEARFALHSLQYDSRMAGFKHHKSTKGEVLIPVKVLNDDGTEVTNDTDFGESVYFCFDTEDNSEKIQRKLIGYKLTKPYTSSTEKTILKKKIWNTTDCKLDDNDSEKIGYQATPADEANWMPVAQFFHEFKIRIRSKHIDFEVVLQTLDKEIKETYTASSFMRNLNFGGTTFFVRNEENLHENRTNVIPFTGSLKAQCANNITRDIQLANFRSDVQGYSKDDLIILHQGERLEAKSLSNFSQKRSNTTSIIKFEAQKPPAVTGFPQIRHSEMRLKSVITNADDDLPPGLSHYSVFNDLNFNGDANDGEWNGHVVLAGILESTDDNYQFNSDGFQDFTIRVKADLDTNCQGEGWVDQNEAYKDYTIRVMKYSAPQFTDVNLHTWESKGLMAAGYHNYERHGVESYWGGPHYEFSEDGRSFYIQQNISSPSFLVSKDDYDSFVLKGVLCTGAYPDCDHEMDSWLDDDMLGFAAGYQRPGTKHKVWPDGKIRSCAGVDYKRKKYYGWFDKNKLRNSLSAAERAEWDGLSESERDEFFGEPTDDVFDMYLFTWWGMKWHNYNWDQSSISVHHYKGLNLYHGYSCGFYEGPYTNYYGLAYYLGWNMMSYYYDRYMSYRGYDMLFEIIDKIRPENTGERNCKSSYAPYNRPNSFSRISYNPGATHLNNCGWGRDAGVKNTVTLTYHPNKFRVNIDNKPYLPETDSQRITAFDLRFDSTHVLKSHTQTAFPYKESSSPSTIPLPTYYWAKRDLTTGFKRFQKGGVAIATFSQPNNQYSNIQIAKLPRYVPLRTASNKPIPKAQNLNYYLSENYLAVSKIYGLLSKSYDPAGDHVEVLVQSDDCIRIGNLGVIKKGNFKSQEVGGKARTMTCKLSGIWKAETEEVEDKTILPVINDMYDINEKAQYKGARASVTTTAGGTIHVFADGSFKYYDLPPGFSDGNAHEDSFYYAVHTEDILNERVSDIKKVYIGFNIENTKPTGVSFKEEDGQLITDKLNFNIAEDDKVNKIVGEIYTTLLQEPDLYDYVRINLGDVPNDDADKDVDHISRFRIDQKDDKYFLVLNDATDIRWADLPDDKKYFSVRIVATDLKGNRRSTTEKVYIDRVDCTETAMEDIQVYKTKAAMTIEGYIQGKLGEKVFRRQTVPMTSGIDKAVITFNFPERAVQPSIKIYEKIIQIGSQDKTIGMIANRCKDSHNFVDRFQIWSNE